MASIDRVMALADEINKKKKKKDYEINTSIVNVNDIANEMKRDNTNAIKEFSYNPNNSTITNKKNEGTWWENILTDTKAIGSNLLSSAGYGGLQFFKSMSMRMDDTQNMYIDAGNKMLEMTIKEMEKDGEDTSNLKQLYKEKYDSKPFYQEKIDKLNQKMEENIESTTNPVARKVAELSQSMGNNAVGMAVTAVNPMAGLVYFTGSAKGSYYDEAINRGMSEEQAENYSGVMALMEGVTERYLAGQNIKGFKSILKGQGLKNIVKAFGIEIGENFVQEAVMPSLSELTALTTAGKEYLNYDFSTGEGWKELLSESWSDGVDGALSAIILNGSTKGIASATRVVNKMKNGQAVSQEEIATAVRDSQQAGVDVKEILQEEIARAAEKKLTQEGKTQEQKIAQEKDIAPIEKTTEKNNVQEQIKIDSENFSKQVDAVKNGTFPKNDMLVLGNTPQVLKDIGLPNLPITMTQKHLDTIMNESGKYAGANYHNLGEDIVKQLPKAINNPLDVVKSKTKDDSVVLTTYLADKNDNTIIASIKIDGKGTVNDIRIDTNVMTSAYGKDNYDSFMGKNLKEGNLLYDIDRGVIKKVTGERLQLPIRSNFSSSDAKTRLQLPRISNTTNTINNSITPQNENVNYTNKYAQQEQKNTQINQNIAPVEEQQNEKVLSTSEETQEKIAEILPETPKLKSKDQRLWTKFRAGIFDKGSIFEDLSLITNNRELMGKWDYMLTSEARAQNAMLNGTKEFDATTKTETQVSKSLYDIQTEVGDNIQEFSNYLYHKHNISRMSLESKAQVQMAELEILKEYNIEEIEKIARKRVTDKTSKDTEELIEKAKEYIRLSKVKNKPVFAKSVTAEISQKIVDQYENNNPEFMDWAKDVYDYNKANLNQLVKSGIISEETADRFEEMYPYYVPIARVNVKGYAINVPLDTNRTGVNAPIKNAKGGNKDILPLFDTMTRRTLQTYKAVAKNNFGVELKNTLNSVVDNQETNVDEILENVDQQDELLKEGKNGKAPTFTVFENGEKVTYEITKDMYDALKPISDSSILSTTFKPFNKISKFHRGVLTEYNPVFMLVNAIKDPQDMLMNSQHPVRTYAKFGEAYAQIIKKGYWYQEYMANGGVRNSYFDSQEGTFNTKDKGLTNIFPLKQISKLNNLVEMAPRLAEYIASREAGSSIEVSMLDAARVTTNFKAGGDITKWANRNGATFLNASIQGAMQQVRNIREANANGLKGYANLALKFTLAGLPAMLLNGLLWDNDEEYEELSDYVKQNYYIVGKYSDGNFIRIPKGRMVSVIQESFNQMKHLITGDDEADLGQFLEVLGNNLAPNNPIQDNVLSPIIQAVTNTTWYGDDLVPTRLQDEPVEEQFDESTDKLSIFLGQKLGISPYKINYVLDQYTGGIGDIFLPMMTQQAENRTDSLLGELISPLTDKFTVDSVMKNQNVSDLYEKSEELMSKANSTSATDEDILQNKYLNSIKTEMNELYRQKREIQNSSLSNSKKYEQVREIQEKINNMAKKAMNNYENIKKTSNYATVGNKEYYLKDDIWTKVKNDELAELKSLNMSIKDKSTYFKLKEEINNIKIFDVDNEKAQIATAVKNTNLADEQKAYVYGKYYASDETLDMVINSGISFNEYLNYASQEFVADKDSNGKSINGSRKTKVIKYINSLQLNIPQKAMLIRKEYSSFNDYNKEIVEYVNDLKIDYTEKVSIFKSLDMKVDTEGNVTW